MSPPFVPDVPYKVQTVFILSFSYIWSTAFLDDYLAPVPKDGEERTEILVSSFAHNFYREPIPCVVS